jgi:hypothetical protein
MTTLNNTQKIGFYSLLVMAIILNILYVLGQTMAPISYDFAVSIGLQEAVEEITEVGVAMNKGFGFGDTVVYMPLFIAGIIGLFKRTTWGFYCMAAALGITLYWPVVCMSILVFALGAEGWGFTDYTSYSVLLGIIFFYGAWGMIYLYRNRRTLINK